MTANLNLNSYKTEFLLFGLNNNLPKYTTLHLTPTACTILPLVVHCKLHYCNSLYYKLSKSQLSFLEQIQNSLARTVVKAPKSCHITPILRSFHWLRISERIEYKLLSLTYEVLTTIQPPYLHKLITSSQYSLFIRRYSCSATDIILSKNNWSLLWFLKNDVFQ